MPSGSSITSAAEAVASDAPLSLHEFPVWLLSVYTRANASLDRPLRRAFISVIHGVALFAIGLSIAVATHMAGIYLHSWPFYTISLLFMFFMGRARWLGLEILERANQLQEVFLVPPAQYFSPLRLIGQRATSLWATIGLSAVLAPTAWIVVAAAFFAPGSTLGSSIRALEPPTFAPEWYLSANAWGKALLIDWFLTIAILFAVPVIYGTTVIVLSIIGTAKQWAVVPVPAYVSAKSQPITGYFNVGALVYAVAVLSLVVLYGGGISLQSILLVSVFVLVGLLCVLIPPVVMQRLVDRAKAQLATSVAEQYRRVISPASSHDESLGGITAQYALSESAEKELLRLQELMQAANQSSGLERQFFSLATASLSQALPYLGFAISAVLRLPHL